MTANITRDDNELLIDSCANFGQTNPELTVARTHNRKINANFLFGALSLRMKVCALTNSCASY